MVLIVQNPNKNVRYSDNCLKPDICGVPEWHWDSSLLDKWTSHPWTVHSWTLFPGIGKAKNGYELGVVRNHPGMNSQEMNCPGAV